MWHACSVFDFGDTGIYTITTNHAVRLIEITLVGFWSVETAKGFVADQELAVAKLGPPYGTRLTLGDVRSFDDGGISRFAERRGRTGDELGRHDLARRVLERARRGNGCRRGVGLGRKLNWGRCR